MSHVDVYGNVSGTEYRGLPITSVTVHSGVLIEDRAFMWCGSLRSVIIRSGLNRIGREAFLIVSLCNQSSSLLG